MAAAVAAGAAAEPRPPLKEAPECALSEPSRPVLKGTGGESTGPPQETAAAHEKEGSPQEAPALSANPYTRDPPGDRTRQPPARRAAQTPLGPSRPELAALISTDPESLDSAAGKLPHKVRFRGREPSQKP